VSKFSNSSFLRRASVSTNRSLFERDSPFFSSTVPCTFSFDVSFWSEDTALASEFPSFPSSHVMVIPNTLSTYSLPSLSFTPKCFPNHTRIMSSGNCQPGIRSTIGHSFHHRQHRKLGVSLDRHSRRGARKHPSEAYVDRQYYGYVVNIRHYCTNSPSPVCLFARTTL
jgi:hypothetical protein